MRSLVAAVAAEHGLKPDSITSWIAPGFAAYLRPDEAARLKQDPRVTRLEQDRRLRWSALWTDNTNGGETTSWGTRAVAGPSTSAPGGPTVYLPDAGVGRHSDFGAPPSESVERISVRGFNPVGCYAHATHVAGIIGAAQNNSGVLGVRPSARIVSVGLGEDNHPTANCSRFPPLTQGPTEDTLRSGLDFIRARLSQPESRRVGIVSLSINLPAAFSEGQPLGDRLRALATPAADYPGAFVVQSAGNAFGSACGFAFDGALRPGHEIDGIMVVGAIDANGQPVVPLNGVGGFRNGSNADTEAGSNFGPCVEVWAPGNNIRSSFAPEPQSASTTYQGDAQLSGTSMAAPHVAGIAAALAAAENLQTPGQIEAALRARLVGLDAKDSLDNPLLLAKLSGGAHTAQPTVEFVIGGTTAANVNAQMIGYSDQSFPLRFDSVGAQTCTLRAFKNNKPWYTIVDAGVRYDWKQIQLAAGSYRWSAECYSPHGPGNSASASATIRPAAAFPTASFFVNGQDTRERVPPYRFRSDEGFTFRYASSGAQYCDLKGEVYGGDTWNLWYSVPRFVTSFDWTTVQLNPDRYRWTIDCFDQYGRRATAEARIDISPAPL